MPETTPDITTETTTNDTTAETPTIPAKIIEGSVLTEAGRKLIGKLLACKGGLKITRAVIGDGSLPDNAALELLTGVIHPIMDAEIAATRYTGDGEATIVAQASSIGVKEGFFITEIGVYALDPDDGEVLYAYVSLHDHPEWMRPESSAVNKFITMDVVVIVGRVESVTAHISPDALARMEDLERYAKLGHRHGIGDIDLLAETLDEHRQNIELVRDVLSNDIQGGTQFTVTFGDLDSVCIEEGVWSPGQKSVYA